jgi:hypothetical protein
MDELTHQNILKRISRAYFDSITTIWLYRLILLNYQRLMAHVLISRFCCKRLSMVSLYYIWTSISNIKCDDEAMQAN